MWMRFAIAILVASVVALGGYVVAVGIVCDHWVWWHPYCAAITGFGDFYATNLRASFFAGFLTLGGFLLSLKTFIVVNMKKEVFDAPTYDALWRNAKKLAKGGRLESKYAPLRDLTFILFAAILSCVATAVLQVTVGLFATWWAAMICLWAAAISISMLVWSLILIRANLNAMFDALDKAANQNPAEAPPAT